MLVGVSLLPSCTRRRIFAAGPVSLPPITGTAATAAGAAASSTTSTPPTTASTVRVPARVERRRALHAHAARD
jgi:hypothetical protein